MSSPSCGCGKAPADPAMLLRARAVMCQVCPRAYRDPGDPLGLRGGGAIQCTVSGRPVVEHVKGEACPRGRHPDVYGELLWLWVRWIGVPMPVRLAMFWWFKGKLAGCGCIAVWKRASVAAIDRWNALAWSLLAWTPPPPSPSPLPSAPA